MEKNENGYAVRSAVSARLSFGEAMNRAAEQVNLKNAPAGEFDGMRELCAIMAEVYMMRPDAVVPIGQEGEQPDGYMVGEVFRQLTQDDLLYVLARFREENRVIYKKRAYLRAMLYNAVFEQHAYWDNRVSVDMGGKRP